MNTIDIVEAIRHQFSITGSLAQVPYIKGRGTFKAELTEDVIRVDNLWTQPFLPWTVFQAAVNILVRYGGRAECGNILSNQLGESGLCLDFEEGLISFFV